MLVGVKTVIDGDGKLKFPSWVNRGLDTDVIVSEVRETSRKPDEVYGMIERMCPGGRKIEIFGRKHNTRPGCVHPPFLPRTLTQSSIVGLPSATNLVQTRYMRRTLLQESKPG